MALWGIGAKWGNDDVSSEFLTNGIIRLGWSKNEAPDLYAMLDEIQVTDFVYIKSFVPNNRMLIIHAVGIVKETVNTNESIKVFWLTDLKENPIKISLNDVKGKNNVYSNTLYKEYSYEIAETIFKNTIRERKD